MKRPILSLVLLVFLLASVTFGRIPFICKIRKVDCKLRPDSKCCQYITTAATITTTTTTVSSVTSDVIENEEQVNETLLVDISNRDAIQAEPSEIDEIVVNITGEAIDARLLTTTKPEKFAPRFCLKLKFNCKLQARHPCCQDPLPSVEEILTPTEDTRQKERQIARQHRKQKRPPSTTIRPNSKRKSTFARTNKRQRLNIQSEISNGVLDNVKEGSRSKSNEIQIFNKKKNLFVKPINTSLFQLKKRPTFGGRNKSPVCRIINCRRNKTHKCCQDEVKVTTAKEETTTEISTTSHEETTEEVTYSIDMTTVDSTTAKEEETTNEKYSKQIQNNEVSTTESVVLSTVPEWIVTELSDKYENTDKDPFEEMYVVSQKESLSSVETRIVQSTGLRWENLDIDGNGLKTLEERKQETDTIDMKLETTTDIQEEFIDYFQPATDNEGEYEEEDDEEKVITVYPVFIPEVSENQVEKEVIISSLKIPVFSHIHSEHSLMFSTPQPEWLPPVYQPEHLEHSPVFYHYGHSVDADATEDSDTTAHYCSTVDCFVHPWDVCCSPHIARKRQIDSTDDSHGLSDSLGDNYIDIDDHDRVTSTVTRVVKSVSW